jgi:CRP-like cAMP-binding protein
MESASATVKTKTQSKIVTWNHQELRELLFRNPSMRHLTQAIFTLDMVKKLRPEISKKAETA